MPRQTYKKDINSHIDKTYFHLRDKTIPTSEERLAIIGEVMNGDQELHSYISSENYRANQVKSSKSFLSEQEFTSRKIDLLTTYILQPSFKDWNIKMNVGSREEGRYYCKKTGKRKAFNRKRYLEEMVDRINGGYAKGAHSGDYVTSEEFATSLSLIEDNTPLWDVLDFTNPEHIKLFMLHYHKLIPEIEGRPDTRMWSVIVSFNEMIYGGQSVFSDVDKRIILCLLEGITEYEMIRERVNEEFGDSFSYRAIRYRVSDGIPNKISQIYEKSMRSMK